MRNLWLLKGTIPQRYMIRKSDVSMLDLVEKCLNDLTVIANQNKEDARVLGKKYIWYSAQKNKDLKLKLCGECEKLSTNTQIFKARASGEGGSGGEWLYDFILREFDSENHFVGVPFVAEIELSDSKSMGLLYDFNKLMQSDADKKAFIFQQKDESGFSDILTHIESALHKYKHKVSSEFLISCWITSEYVFKSKRILVNSV